MISILTSSRNLYISLTLIKLTFIKYPLLTVEKRALLSSVVYAHEAVLEEVPLPF